MNKTNIAFVRVPKTAGTFLNIHLIPEKHKYKNKYGNNHLSVSQIKKIVDENTPFFTLVRDPYNRACSEYFFIKRMIVVSELNPDDEKNIKHVANRIMANMGSKIYYHKTFNIYRNSMSLEDYLEDYNNFQTYPFYYDTMLPKDFDLIGITENMRKTVALLKSAYNIKCGDGDINPNLIKRYGPDYETSYSRSDFKSKNEIEYEIYDQSLIKFNSLCSKYL